jgi:hypothetical protein
MLPPFMLPSSILSLEVFVAGTAYAIRTGRRKTIGVIKTRMSRTIASRIASCKFRTTLLADCIFALCFYAWARALGAGACSWRTDGFGGYGERLKFADKRRGRRTISGAIGRIIELEYRIRRLTIAGQAISWIEEVLSTIILADMLATCGHFLLSSLTVLSQPTAGRSCC